MKTYPVKVDGVIYDVKADREPTVDEVRARIAGQSAPSPTPTPASSPVAAQQAQPAQQRPGLSSLAASARTSSMGGLTMGAPDLTPYGADIVRYGGPAGPALLAGPAGFIAAAGAGLVSNLFSEAGAQGLEKMQGTRPEYSPREMGAAGAMGMTAPTRLAPKILPAVSNFLASSAVNVGSSEVGRFIQEGDVKKPSSTEEAILRFGLPVGLSAFSSLGGAKASKIQEAKKNRDDRLLERGNTSLMVSEIIPDLTALEARVIGDGNELAIKALNNLDAEIGPALAKTYEGFKDSAEIAEKLSPHVGELTRLQNTARLARDEAVRLERQAAEAGASLRADSLKLKADAKDAAMVAAQEQIVYDIGLQTIFGGVSPKIGTVITGASMENLRAVSKAAKDAIESGLDRAYLNLNIGQNDPVVSIDEIVRSATKASAKGKGLEGNIANAEFVTALGSSLKTLDPDGTGLLTLEAYRKFRDTFVQELSKTQSRSNANRIASSSYNVIKEAADSYISKNIPGKSEAWKLTNAQAAAVYGAKKTDVIELIAEGDMTGVLSLMKKEKLATPILNEIDAYAYSITGLGGKRAVNAANRFKKDFLGAMRDTLVEDSLHLGKGQDNVAKIVDFPKLITTLDELRQRKFPIEELNLGTAQDIKQLAKVVAAGKQGGMTSDQFSEYIKNSNNFGSEAAAARFAYDSAYKDFIISRDVKTRANAAARMDKEAKASNFQAGEIEKAQILAAQDPLVRLLNDTKMNLSKDPSENGQWVASLFSMSPSVVGRFVDALETSGRSNVLEDLRKSAMAEVMRDTFSKTQEVAKKQINSKTALNFFQGENGAERREILKTLMGGAEYANFEKNFSKPIERIVNIRTALGGNYPNIEDYVKPLSTTKAAIEGRVISGFTPSSAFSGIRKLIDEQRYNAAYLLYVNPSTANAYAALAYDADKFIKSSAANSFALKLAMEEDNRNLSQQAPSR